LSGGTSTRRPPGGEFHDNVQEIIAFRGRAQRAFVGKRGLGYFE
jgi:hypothetical protein